MQQGGQKEPMTVQLVLTQQIPNKTIEQWPIKQKMVQALNHPKNADNKLDAKQISTMVQIFKECIAE